MVDGLSGLTAITFYTLIQEIKGTNHTVTAEYTESYPKVVITVCIALFAVTLAVIIAKVANVCHDKHVIEDDSSDISDNTRSIIKARLALISLQRRSRNVSIGQRFFKLWSKKANNTLTGDGDKNTIIKVEEARSPIDVKTKNSTGKLNILLSNKITDVSETQSKKNIKSQSNATKPDTAACQSKKDTTSQSNATKPDTAACQSKKDIKSQSNATKPATAASTSTSTLVSNPSSPKTQQRVATPSPQSVRRQDSFVGPNVSRSDSLPNASPPGKRRDVTSATAVSISVSFNGNNKSKKSVTFEDEVVKNGDSPSNSKLSDTNNSNKSNLKKK